jgi:hypothetical protein
MIFDATVGGSDSTSFVTVEEADAYFSVHPFGENWFELDQSQKESYLMMSTRSISALCWTGQATSPDQALAWPRVGMVSTTGYPIPDNVIPKEIKYMTMELAFRTYSEGSTGSSSTGDQGLKRVKAGSVEVEYFNPGDVETTFSLVPTDIKMYGNQSWFCSDSTKFAEFVVL